MSEPVICFGQQPCGVFPRRFLYSKILTAKRLQARIGGRIAFFYHDSDHDPRETATKIMREDSEEWNLNFTISNKVQKKFSPLFCKEVAEEWVEKTTRQLPQWVDRQLVEVFKSVGSRTVGAFCLEMYQKMGLLDDVRIVRSGDALVRESAIEITDYFVDIEYEGETVRARIDGDRCKLHKGGQSFIEIDLPPHQKSQISPTRDERLLWMQSVLNCTHYIAGAGELGYLNTAQAPEISFIKRDDIEHSSYAYTSLNHDF